MLWYLPVSPWSWSCTFACIISAWLSRGITSWYQSRLSVYTRLLRSYDGPKSQLTPPTTTTTTRGSPLLRGGRRRLGVVRRLPGRRPCLFDPVVVFLAFLTHTCLPYVCTQILLLPLTHLYSSPRGPWLVLWCLEDLFMFLELCCDIFPWVPHLDRTRCVYD